MPENQTQENPIVAIVAQSGVEQDTALMLQNTDNSILVSNITELKEKRDKITKEINDLAKQLTKVFPTS